MQSNLEIELENFKGPLAVLLELIEKRKLPINEISLTQVADDFISKAQSMNFSKGSYAEFITLSATLILIKSRTLLPVEERDGTEDPESEELKQRLKALSLLKKYAGTTRSYYAKQSLKRLKNLKKVLKDDIKYKRPDTFIIRHKEFANQILSQLPSFQKESVKISRKKIRSLEEVLKDIESKLNEYVKIRFSDLKTESKEDKVVSFLAVLELKRKGIVELKQNNNGDIEIEKNLINAPFYG